MSFYDSLENKARIQFEPNDEKAKRVSKSSEVFFCG